MMPETHPDEHALLAYADGERDPAVAEHVAACAACADQVRLLEAGRDALRAAPLLELGEKRRKELIASLPERRERWAPLRARLGPAAAAAAALVLLAGVIALATLGNGNGGGDEEGAAVGGGAELRESAEGGVAPATTGTEDRATELTRAPVRRVQGPAEEVIRLLQSQGIAAVRRDGSVVAVGDRDDVLAALAGRPRGGVAVYVR